MYLGREVGVSQACETSSLPQKNITEPSLVRVSCRQSQTLWLWETGVCHIRRTELHGPEAGSVGDPRWMPRTAETKSIKTWKPRRSWARSKAGDHCFPPPAPGKAWCCPVTFAWCFPMFTCSVPGARLTKHRSPNTEPTKHFALPFYRGPWLIWWGSWTSLLIYKCSLHDLWIWFLSPHFLDRLL